MSPHAETQRELHRPFVPRTTSQLLVTGFWEEPTPPEASGRLLLVAQHEELAEMGRPVTPETTKKEPSGTQYCRTPL